MGYSPFEIGCAAKFQDLHVRRRFSCSGVLHRIITSSAINSFTPSDSRPRRLLGWPSLPIVQAPRIRYSSRRILWAFQTSPAWTNGMERNARVTQFSYGICHASHQSARSKSPMAADCEEHRGSGVAVAGNRVEECRPRAAERQPKILLCFELSGQGMCG